jgi:surface protein
MYAELFNGDLSKWKVSNVTNMTAMFRNAELFNGDLSEWDVSNVSKRSGMFLGTKSSTWGDLSE